MIVGVGIDQVEVARMAGLLARRPERARGRLFTEGERARCDGRVEPAECYAVRFAAKEAFLKAVGTGWDGSVAWREMEVVSGPGGRPRLRVDGAAARRLRQAGASSIHLSCTHEAGVAAAVVILEG